MHSYWDDRVPTFPKGISPKVNVMFPVEFKHDSHDGAVQYVTYFATGTRYFFLLENTAEYTIEY